MEQTLVKRTNNKLNCDSKRPKCGLIANSKTIDRNSFKLNISNNKVRSDAITELELIYDKLCLYLNDEELLDRAERRDLPFRFQYYWNKDSNGSNHSIDGKSGPQLRAICDNNNNDQSYESFNKRRSMATMEALVKNINNYKTDDLMVRSRTPPYRRSAIPDIINDDFAFRKYNKSLSHNQLCSTKEINGLNDNNNTYMNGFQNKKCMSYLPFMSSNDEIYSNRNNNNYYKNKIGSDYDLKYLSSANIKVDDLSNRKMRQSDAANVLPPHPPFGIPNSIVSHSSPNDYIRAELDPKELGKTRFRCKSNVPHLIHDDMAFRSLRRDSLRQNMSTIKRTTSISCLPISPVPQRLSSSLV